MCSSRLFQVSRHSARLVILIAILAVPLLPLSTRASDFARLDAHIALQRETLEQLEDSLNRLHPDLVEPLTSLALAHMEANQFDEADALLDRTIQIVRVNHGLYHPLQFDLLQLEVENNRQRGNWEEVNQELDHLYWLYTNKFEGSLRDLVYRLGWLSERHLDGVVEDIIEHQGIHLRTATGINRLAVLLTAKYPVLPSGDRAELLYDLALKYHLEAQAIRRGGRTGYSLRELVVGSNLMEGRKEALARRYQLGLDVLAEIRQTLSAQEPSNILALAELDLKIADWKLLFNKAGDTRVLYRAAYDGLLAAGYTRDQLDSYFALPLPLPRRELLGDIAAVIQQGKPGLAGAGGSESLLLVELHENLPGYVAGDISAHSKSYRAARRMDIPVLCEITATGSEARLLNMSPTVMLADNSGMRVMASPEVLAKLSTRVTHRVEAIQFRPALINGEAESARINLRYRTLLPPDTQLSGVGLSQI